MQLNNIILGNSDVQKSEGSAARGLCMLIMSLWNDLFAFIDISLQFVTIPFGNFWLWIF